MASLEPVAAGFVVIPSKQRERDYLQFLLKRGDRDVPLEDALYEIRETRDGSALMLLPFRSYDAARRLCKAFEQACRDHQKAAKERASMSPVPD